MCGLHTNFSSTCAYIKADIRKNAIATFMKIGTLTEGC